MADPHYIPKNIATKYPALLNDTPVADHALMLDILQQTKTPQPENARIVQDALARTAVSALRPTQNENATFLIDLVHEFRGVQKFETWGDAEKTGYIAGALDHLGPISAKKDKTPLVAAVNYPHGDNSPPYISRDISRARQALADHPAHPLEIDMAMDYCAFLDGKKIDVEQKLLTAAAACVTERASLTVTLMANIHAYADNPVQSLYDATIMALECGADAVKTCTDMTAKPPYNFSVSRDVSTLENTLPVLRAVKDFNTQNGTTRGIVIAGGLSNEIDIVRFHKLSEAVLGAVDAQKLVSYSGDHWLHRRLRTFLQEENAALPKGQHLPVRDAQNDPLPPHMQGPTRRQEM